jgi:uncharacterized protein YceH (UPF0502 family)
MYERRVLGVLVEKAKTTPDIYPLSVNALVTGCNQKSNRDPLLDLSDTDVEDTLAGLQKKGLVVKITGGRVVRWRHTLYESFRVGKVELAILGELLLRGPQTEGELRGRASRMEPIEDLDSLRAVLVPMAERNLVVYLSPAGRRGTVVSHGFHEPGERDRLMTLHQAEAAAAEAATPPPTVRQADSRGLSSNSALTVLEGRLGEAQAEIAALKDIVTTLQASVATLTEKVEVLSTPR